MDIVMVAGPTAHRVPAADAFQPSRSVMNGTVWPGST